MRSKRMYITNKCILTIALMGFMASPAHGVLYEQAPPDPTLLGHFSYIDPGGNADNFTLSMGSWVTAFTWYGYYADADLADGVSSVNFLVRLYSNNTSGIYPLPGGVLYDATLTASVTDSGLDVDDGLYDDKTIYRFIADLSSSPVLVAAGETWLSVVENSSEDPSWLWSRYNSTPLGSAFQYLDSTWAVGDSNHAFSL